MSRTIKPGDLVYYKEYWALRDTACTERRGLIVERLYANNRDSRYDLLTIYWFETKNTTERTPLTLGARCYSKDDKGKIVTIK